MERIILFTGIVFLLFSCIDETELENGKDIEVVEEGVELDSFGCSTFTHTEGHQLLIFPNSYSKMINTLIGRDKGDTIYKKEYHFDDLGRVEAYHYFNYANPQYNFVNSFVYDSNNRLLEEYHNDTLFVKYFWHQDSVKSLLLKNCSVIEIAMTGNKISSVEFQNGRFNRFEYEGENLVSISGKDKLFTEIFEYQSDIIHPDYYLKSIEVSLIRGFYPFSKNIAHKQKDQPIYEDDFTIPERTYEYSYEIGQENKVLSTSNNRSFIYKETFEYFE